MELLLKICLSFLCRKNPVIWRNDVPVHRAVNGAGIADAAFFSPHICNLNITDPIFKPSLTQIHFHAEMPHAKFKPKANFYGQLMNP